MSIPLKVIVPEPIELEITSATSVPYNTNEYVPVRVLDYEKYTGSYEFTPSDVAQTIQITDKVSTQDIIINPIPQNYGLVTWNGSTLTVS